MTEVDSRNIAFKNDHTYLKTAYNGQEDIQLLQTNISELEPENDVNVLPKSLLATKQQNIVNKTTPKIVNTLNVPNSNIIFLPDAINFPLSSNLKLSQNNLSVKNIVIGNKSSVRPIQPKVINTSKFVPATQPQPNIFLITPTHTSFNTNFQNVMSKIGPAKPVELQEKPCIKPIKPMKNQIVQNNANETCSTLLNYKPKIHSKPQDKSIIKSLKPIKNKKIQDNENAVCTIKLSSDLLKRIQSGEKLFMCMECDKIYTEHTDLLNHQKMHDKYDKKIIVSENEIRERTLTDNVEKITVIESDEPVNDNTIVTKQTKSNFKPSVNPKKRKVIFQGECTMCHSVFPDLGKHIRTVHNNELNKNKVNKWVDNLKFHCYKCNMEFDIKQQLRAHELSAHKHTYEYNCDHCFKEFAFKEDLKTHVETHHNDSMKYLCPYCDAGFRYSNGLRTHLVKHISINNSDNSIIEIPDSPKELSSTRLPEHINQLFTELDKVSGHADEIFIEQESDDNYRVDFRKDSEDNTSLQLNSLIDKNHKIDSELNIVSLEDNNKIIINQQQTVSSVKKRVSYTVCRICFIIVSYSRIGGHMKKKHNNAAPYQCEICHADFNRKHIMDDHRRKHTNNKPHKCPECTKCFTYKHHLNRHMMIVHNAESLEKPFKCSACDKAFSFKEYLTLHINSRHKGKHYMCQICGKNFSTNAALNKHQLCHTDERPFMCEHCGRTFKCKTHCDTHTKNMHPGDLQLDTLPEKFECNLCNKQFTTKVYRDMHLKRHNGQGHQCDICYKLFVSKAHKLRHIKIMHRR